MARICGIYKITSPSGKIYIGQSVHIKHRMIAYRKLDCDRQPKLFNSLLKHGFEAHTVEILKICPKNELDEWEKWFIDVHDSFDTLHGLNCASGGRINFKKDKDSSAKLRRPKSPETIAKIKAAKALNKKPVSEETREKMRNNNLGRKHSEEAKQKVSLATKGRRHSQKTKDILAELNRLRPRKTGYTQRFSPTRGASVSKALKGNPNLHSVAKTIYCKDEDGVILKFLKVKDCMEVTGVCSKSVWNSRTTGKPVKGFYFSFKPFE